MSKRNDDDLPFQFIYFALFIVQNEKKNEKKKIKKDRN